MRILAVILMFSAFAVRAQEGIRDTDSRLSKVEMTEMLVGQVLEFYTNGFASYYADGRYDYRYEADGERVLGAYEIMDDSSVCMIFDNGFERCDYLVQAGERLVMIIANGERYPVRAKTAIE